MKLNLLVNECKELFKCHNFNNKTRRRNTAILKHTIRSWNIHVENVKHILRIVSEEESKTTNLNEKTTNLRKIYRKSILKHRK